MSGKAKAQEKEELRPNGVEISMEELVNIYNALTLLKKKPTCLWYAVKKNLRILKPHFEEMLEMKKDILVKYGGSEDGKFDDEANKKEALDLFTKKLKEDKVRVVFYEEMIREELINEKLPYEIIEILEDRILMDYDE